MATHGDEVKIQNRQEADSAKTKRKRRLTALTLLFALAAVAAGSAFFYGGSTKRKRKTLMLSDAWFRLRRKRAVWCGRCCMMIRML